MGTSSRTMPHARSRQVRGNEKGRKTQSRLLPKSPPRRRGSGPGVPGRYWARNELLRLGQRYMQKFISLLPLVLEDKDRASVHTIRVASRRLEQIITLIYSEPLPPYAHKLRQRAKRCRHLLRRLSDFDMLLALSESSLRNNGSRNLAAWQALAEFLHHRRAKVLARDLQELSRIQFASPCARFQRDLDENTVSPRVHYGGKFRKVGPKKADRLVEQRLLKTLSTTWQAFEAMLEKSRRDPREQVIHQIRIAGKRLRHVVEVMKKLGVSGSRQTLDRLRIALKAIGQWHDLEVLEQQTSALLLQKKFVREHLELAVQVEQLFLANREFKKKYEEQFRRMAARSRDYRDIKVWVESKLRIRPA